MKAEILCLAVCFCCMIYQNEAHIRRFKNKVVSHSYPTYWFYQKLDHFNAADVRMWKQVYYTTKSCHIVHIYRACGRFCIKNRRFSI